MVGTHADTAGLIEFWRAVEMLEPQKVPEPERAKAPGGPFIIDVGPDEPGPWEPGQPATAGRSWQLTVYGGLFKTTGVTAALTRTLGVIVLGGDPTSGARAWATQKPNLLNVAVSRAKRRLYVIGDRDDWRRRPGTDVLSEQLPDHAPW